MEQNELESRFMEERGKIQYASKLKESDYLKSLGDFKNREEEWKNRESVWKNQEG